MVLAWPSTRVPIACDGRAARRHRGGGRRASTMLACSSASVCTQRRRSASYAPTDVSRSALNGVSASDASLPDRASRSRCMRHGVHARQARRRRPLSPMPLDDLRVSLARVVHDDRRADREVVRGEGGALALAHVLDDGSAWARVTRGRVTGHGEGEGKGEGEEGKDEGEGWRQRLALAFGWSTERRWPGRAARCRRAPARRASPSTASRFCPSGRRHSAAAVAASTKGSSRWMGRSASRCA